MKGIIKFMTAAVAVGSLASCTDDLVTSSQQVKEGDLTGYLEITDQAATRVAYAPGEGYVWDDEDAIKVYTVDQLLYNNYYLIGGEGTVQGEFKLDGSDKISGSSSKKYAVTEPKGSKTIYGISATDDGKAFLTATVKPQYDWDDVITMADGTEKEAYKLPTPFWGIAQVNGSKINVAFKALTAFIKLDLRRVPAGTQAIVLTSHEDYYTGAAKGEGGVLHAGGGNEPLAGTMNAVLDENNVSKLQADTRLAAYDTLRIDFPKIEELAGQDKIIYLPVPAQHYDKLDILAVSEDNRAPYTWNKVDILASYSDEEFQVGWTKGIYLDAEYNIPAEVTSPKEISNRIAKRLDGNHTVRVKVLGAVDPTTGDDEILILNNGQPDLAYTDVEITFAQAPKAALKITECPATLGLGGAFVSWDDESPYKAKHDDAQTTQQSKEAKQKLTLKFNAGSDKDLLIAAPESDVTLETGDDFSGEVKVTAAATNKISGYDVTPRNQKDAGLTVKGGNKFTKITMRADSWKTAVYAYEDNTEILTLDMMPTQPGNVRLTDALLGKVSYHTLNSTPAIITTGAAAMKELDDASNTVKVRAYWTGKAISDYAVQNEYEGAKVKDDEKTTGVIYTAAQLQAVGLDKSLEAAGSTWKSGAGVLDYMISKKVSFIWLGGQEFPWLGAQIGKMKPDITIDGIAYSQRDLVAPVYKADWNSFKPQQLTENVKIDCNEVELRNMELTINDPYFIDPHRCCTSCGEMAVKVERDLGLFRNINTTAMAEVSNVRLNDVELVCADDKVDIPNVGAIVGRINADNNVTMNNNRATNVQIAIAGGNVGGHVGNLICKSGAVKINDALAGLYDYNPSNTTIDDKGIVQNMAKYAESEVYTNFVVTQGSNAGGLVGNLLAPTGLVQIVGANVGMFAVAAEKGNNAGGLVGNLAYGAGALNTSSLDPTTGHAAQFKTATEGNLSKPSVLRGNVAIDIIWALENPRKATTASVWGSTGDNVGGFAGKAYAAQVDANDFSIKDRTNMQLIADGTVKAISVLAQGRYAGGLIGYNHQQEDAFSDHVAGTFISSITDKRHDTNVTITSLEATNSVAGGLVGLQAKGDLVIGGGFNAGKEDAANNQSLVTVEITTLSTAFAGGGLVGRNLDDVDINAKTRENAKSAATITAKVTNWENTWAASNFTSGWAGEGEDNMRKNCGTFDNLGGLMSEHFKVKNNANIVTNGKIPDTTKKALLFQLHTDATNTKGVNTDPYWGDQLGYVGYADQTSFYLLDGKDYRQGDQEFNYRMPY